VTVPHSQDDLPGLLLGELPPATAVAVDRHLAGCDPCRRDLAAVAVASSALRDVARLPFAETPSHPPMRLPAGDPDRPGDRGELPASVPHDRSRWLLGAAAVLVALALGVGGLTIGRDPDTARGQTVALTAPAAGAATAEARMRGGGDDQIMTMTAKGLPRPPAGAYYEVWLVGDTGEEFPVGVLAPNGEGIWSLPADVAARYRSIDVTVEPADGNPSRSDRTVLRGTYA
jgi:anti-sigma factor RsiW